MKVLKPKSSEMRFLNPWLGIVVVLASLSYLGFGSTAMSWGRMIYENQGALSIQPWAVLAPVILIGMFLVGANMLRDGITRRAGTP